MRNIIPVVMAGILGIYGLIVGAVLAGKITQPGAGGATTYSSYAGYAHLASGLSCGLSAMAAGLAIGIVGDAGVRAIGKNEDLFVSQLLVLIFAEALSLYGLIVSLILSGKSPTGVC
jgi:V-type H+-transporting ATPase 16kDa proteolipid subunit